MYLLSIEHANWANMIYLYIMFDTNSQHQIAVVIFTFIRSSTFFHNAVTVIESRSLIKAWHV